MELGRHFGRMEGTATPNIEGKVVLRLEWLKECIDAGKVFGPECGYRGWEVRYVEYIWTEIPDGVGDLMIHACITTHLC